MKNTLLLIIGFAMFGAVNSTVSSTQSEIAISSVSVCGPLHANLTNQVRVRAIYSVGFEWSDLYSLRCPNAPRIWVDFSDDWKAHTQKSARKQLSRFEGTYGVTFVGVIGASGGHMGAYPVTFKVTSVEEARRLSKESALPDALSPSLRRRVESFEASH